MSIQGYLVAISNNTLNELVADPEQAINYLDNHEELKLAKFELGKDWHAIHFILTGDAKLTGKKEFILAKVVLGINMIQMDFGSYSPLCATPPDQVKTIAEALVLISEYEFKAKINPHVLEEQNIYPESWQDPEDIAYLTKTFEGLKAFYQEAAQNNLVVLSYLA